MADTAASSGADPIRLAEQRRQQLHDTAGHVYLAAPSPSDDLIRQAYAPAAAMASLLQGLRTADR
jgi:uncharacterized membrane protein